MIFVPGDDYFKIKFGNIKNSLSRKLKLDLEQLNTLNFEGKPFESIVGNIDGQMVTFIDMGFINDNIGVIRTFIGSILYIFLFYYNYRMVLSMIRSYHYGNEGGK